MQRIYVDDVVGAILAQLSLEVEHWNLSKAKAAVIMLDNYWKEVSILF